MQMFTILLTVNNEERHCAQTNQHPAQQLPHKYMLCVCVVIIITGINNESRSAERTHAVKRTKSAKDAKTELTFHL